ncbi:MAG: hypothetical protein AB7V46_22535 [Thermomicrobiales bacterium]
MMRYAIFLSMTLSLSVGEAARSSWHVLKRRGTHNAVDWSQGYDGPHKEILDRAAHLQLSKKTGLGKVIAPITRMGQAIGFVLDHFGPVTIFSEESETEDWSMTLRKRPTTTVKWGPLSSKRSNGWGLFVEHMAKSSSSRVAHVDHLDEDLESSEQRLFDLGRSSEQIEFLNRHSALVEKLPDSALVKALFSFLQTRDEAIPDIHDRDLNQKLKSRAQERISEVDVKYSQMNQTLHALDLEKIARRGRILLTGTWDSSVDDSAGPNVAFFLPGRDSAYMSGFRANRGQAIYNLDERNDRLRFASLYPHLFDRLDSIVIDKYETSRSDSERLRRKIEQIIASETGKTITALAHPAFVAILEKAQPEDGPILVGRLPKPGSNNLSADSELSLKLTRSGRGEPTLIVVDQDEQILRWLTSSLPTDDIELTKFEETERTLGAVPSNLLIDFVRRHNEATKRGAFSIHDLSAEDPRNYGVGGEAN